jgi:hypothetical protein
MTHETIPQDRLGKAAVPDGVDAPETLVDAGDLEHHRHVESSPSCCPMLPPLPVELPENARRPRALFIPIPAILDPANP